MTTESYSAIIHDYEHFDNIVADHLFRALDENKFDLLLTHLGECDNEGEEVR